MSATDFADPRQIIHIPARELAGSRAAKLAELDVLLAQLQVIRLALSDPDVRLDSPAAPGERRRDDHSGRNRLAGRVRDLLSGVRRFGNTQGTW